MGYAKLNLPTTVTSSNALYDLVRCITGNISNVADLTFAVSASSELVNTLGENWTITYGDLTASTTTYVLESNCVVEGKKHYTRLISSNANAMFATTALSTNFAGINLTTCSGATAANIVTNETFYSFSGSTAVGSSSIGVTANSPFIYASWSRYHLMIWGLLGQTTSARAGTGFQGSFEYPETSLTQFTNTAPLVHLRWNHTANVAFNNATTRGTFVSSNIVLQGTNVHDPANSTTSGVFNFGVNGFGTCQMQVFDPVKSIDSTGADTYPLTPLYWCTSGNAIPLINLSQLSQVYRISKASGAPESVFTVGNVDYVNFHMTLGNVQSTTSNASIAVRKA